MSTHLSPPWVTLYHMISKLFEYDPEVKVEQDEETYAINLYVEDQRKADALTKLLPASKEYGNVIVPINVIPANVEEPSKILLFQDAFEGNEAISCFYTGCGPTKDINYIAFDPIVVQFFNDQLDDINGLKTTLYADIAKEVFGQQDGIYFCTDPADESLEIPLGEWP